MTCSRTWNWAPSAGAAGASARTLERVFELSILAERRHQVAGSLSGGEQQMCAIGRALMSRPRILMLDEPTEGLAPLYVERLFELIMRLRDSGLTILLVEQNVEHVSQDRGSWIRSGERAYRARSTGRALLQDPRLKTAYLGLLRWRMSFWKTGSGFPVHALKELINDPRRSCPSRSRSICPFRRDRRALCGLA